ncbi:epoxyqueuosine reductase [bacterium]|nr:MAG: epoxyqueuosine reductase [bacterium]
MVTIDDLRGCLTDFVARAASEEGRKAWWRKPILAAGRVDKRFQVLKEAVSEDHLLPEDLLPSARTVIVFFLPFTENLVQENREGNLACRNWGLAYTETNALIAEISEALSAFLAEHAYRSAVTPPTHNFDEERLISHWSHRHLAHLVGLGRFGVHRQIITPEGSAGRLGSLVTEADLGNHPLHVDVQACLHMAGRECLACARRCPVNALTDEFFDRFSCWDQCLVNDRNLADLPTTDVCGKCVAVVPCSFQNPVVPYQK